MKSIKWKRIENKRKRQKKEEIHTRKNSIIKIICALTLFITALINQFSPIKLIDLLSSLSMFDGLNVIYILIGMLIFLSIISNYELRKLLGALIISVMLLFLLSFLLVINDIPLEPINKTNEQLGNIMPWFYNYLLCPELLFFSLFFLHKFIIKSYKTFVINVPKVKDRTNIILIILGTVVSAIALFK